MDIETMQAEAAINAFIETFMEMVQQSSELETDGFSSEDIEQFQVMLSVVKVVHLAQMNVEKLREAFQKDDDD